MSIALLLVYFVYGLSFLTMGLALLLETGRAASPAQARGLLWLAGFAILHGSHEWLEAYLLQAQSLGAPLASWLGWLRLALLVSSFSLLLGYAALTLRQVPSPQDSRPLYYALPGLLGLAVLVAAVRAPSGTPVPWVRLLDAASRYALAIPAALLASLALRTVARAAQAEMRTSVAKDLQLAALGFGIYALTQVFVQPLAWFPASIINQDSFLALTGIPIQAIRAAMAALISVGLLRAMQAAEQERQSQLVGAQRARLTALEQRDTLRRDLLRHVVRSQEDERARIARELHDDMAQTLSAFSLELGALRTRLRRADTTRMVDRLLDLARQMSQGLYHLVGDLRPSHLDNLGLVPALKYAIHQDFESKGLDIAFNVVGNSRPLGGLLDTALFRVAQESLTNVTRHAGVRHAELDLTYDCDRVVLRIRDGGRGFDPSENFRPPRGWGLVGMRERVESLSGQLQVLSAPGQGTLIEAVVPLNADENRD